MRADRGAPGDPTPFRDRQTDRGKAAAPIPRCGPRGPDCSIVSPIFGPGCPPNAQTVLDKGPWEGAAPGTPHIACWEAGIWALLTRPRFPHLYKEEEGRGALGPPS